MKQNLGISYPYIGDYFGYKVVTSADGTVSTNVYETVPTRVALSLTVNLLGELIILSQTKMQLAGYIGNIVDKNGDQIYEDGVWEITQTAPLLNGLGVKGGYKYRAKIIQGNI